MNKIVISMGDPTGIGPEVITKTVAELRKTTKQLNAQLFVVGDEKIMAKAAQQWAPELNVQSISHLECSPAPDTISVLTTTNPINTENFCWGKPNLETDKAQLSYIYSALEQVTSNLADAIVTAPVSKSSLKRAGCIYPGHTELLAAYTNTLDPVMMLAGPTLRVVPLTIHIPLSEVPKAINKPLLAHTIKVTHKSLQKYFGITSPRIGVAGLNPHAGDGGLFGDEDDLVIAPTCKEAQEQGLLVQGPISGDAVFNQAKDGIFDAVIGMYHDQALIPLKLLDFDHAVNVTLGLPIIRTSVDHGTAYDIAGKGVASASSMIAAVELAAQMIKNNKSC